MFKKFALASAAFALVATAVFAQSQGPNPSVLARQSHMRLNAFNLGILGAMAQQKADYDATSAQAAADNLVTLATLSMGAYFPEGTDSASIEGTRALPAIWSDMAGVAKAASNEHEAALAMQAAAGQGLEALQGAMGALGGACGGCHQNYRQSQ